MLMNTNVLDAPEAQTGKPLEDYLAERKDGEGGLGPGARLQVIDALIRVLNGAYCHLPQKRAAYALNPVQALRLLRTRAVELTEGEFHLAVSAIITGLRDAHTVYVGPKPLQGAVAALPFLVEQYGPHGQPTFIASKVADALVAHADPQFAAGVELTSWNGIPFARAVDLHADRETGGRPDARRARAVESLTFRALQYGPPPDERWVTVGYRRPDGSEHEVRLYWRVLEPNAKPAPGNEGTRQAQRMAIDPAAEQVRHAKKLMFSYDLWKAEQDQVPAARGSDWLRTEMHDVFAARNVTTSRGEVGYLRIWSFDVDDDEAFIEELCRLLELLSPDGLIIDLRGNPGGLIWAAERALQLFTPNPIVPARFSLLATALTKAMARSPFNRMELDAWLPSLDAALSTGDQYSQPLPLTDPEWCNDVGQHYSGPAVCVVDPNTYSSGDLFAAGFVDNQIGPLVSVGGASGAGGANVWTYYDLRDALGDTPFALPPLPNGINFSVAIRRAIRSGAADGTPIEDFGIPGISCAMTRDDLLRDNVDLREFCARCLPDGARTSMKVRHGEGGLTLETRGLHELETYVNGRPLEPVREITDGPIPFVNLREAIDKLLGGTGRDAVVEFVGRRNGQIVQRRRVKV